MIGRKESAMEKEARSLERSWTRIGRNLYRMHADGAGEVAEKQARSIEQSCHGELRACEAALSNVERELKKAEAALGKKCVVEGLTAEEVRSGVRGAKIRLAIASLMVVVGICIIAWSLGPFFYGNEVLWFVVSGGAGIVIFVCMEVLLSFVEKILNGRQFAMFNALVAAVMVAFFIAGFVQMSQARSVQVQIRQVLDSDTGVFNEDMEDVGRLKKRLNTLAERAMVCLFIGFEWLTGVFFYLAARRLGRLGPIAELARRRDRMVAERKRLMQRKALLEGMNSQTVEAHVRNGIEQERNKGSLPLMVAILIIIVGVCAGVLLLSEKGFGRECTYYLIGYDVTGSTEHDQRENQRAIVKIINGLEACDELQLMNITQETFSSPEYVVHQRMPSKAGYFEEEIRRARLRLINEFRSKCENISKSRPCTSILDGLVMFSQILQERRGMKRRLVLISDMLQFKKDLNPSRIASQGGKVLTELKAEGLIPDMQGIEVYVMGASTAGTDTKTWMGVKRFWVNYFKEAGAALKCYSIQRNWPAE